MHGYFLVLGMYRRKNCKKISLDALTSREFFIALKLFNDGSFVIFFVVNCFVKEFFNIFGRRSSHGSYDVGYDEGCEECRNDFIHASMTHSYEPKDVDCSTGNDTCESTC